MKGASHSGVEVRFEHGDVYLEEEAGAADLGCESVGEGCGRGIRRAGGQWGGRRGLGVGSAGGRVVVDGFAGELGLG